MKPQTRKKWLIKQTRKPTTPAEREPLSAPPLVCLFSRRNPVFYTVMSTLKWHFLIKVKPSLFSPASKIAEIQIVRFSFIN